MSTASSDLCEQTLQRHPALRKRDEASSRRLKEVRKRFEENELLRQLPVSIFCAGSLARREAGLRSDLDLFVTADKLKDLGGRLHEYELFGQLISINESLGLPPFSNDGEYLKIYCADELRSRTGSRADDSENLFTARMLLMLESEPLFNDGLYNSHLTSIVENYYRDKKGKHSFRPLFLLNDILRYWRTLCLNYEERREEPGRPWRKKNVNLKFSRMLTVFATVLPLVLTPLERPDEFIALCRQIPLRRLARAIDRLGDESLTRDWPRLLDNYEAFLSWKEDESTEARLQELRETIRESAELLSTFLYRALTSDRIAFEFRRYLIL